MAAYKKLIAGIAFLAVTVLLMAMGAEYTLEFRVGVSPLRV